MHMTCVLGGIDLASVSMGFLLDFRTVLTLWYFSLLYLVCYGASILPLFLRVFY